MGSALGAAKVAAKRFGVSLFEYMRRRDAGLKACIFCREWKNVDQFNGDVTRADGLTAGCAECRRLRAREAYEPRSTLLPMGPLRIPRRDGDKRQARARINADVESGLRPSPEDLHCVQCGHKGTDRRHEYHHHMGYSAEHHYDVLPMCSRCHHEEH